MSETKPQSSAAMTSKISEEELSMLSSKTIRTDTESVYRQIVVNLTANYSHLQQYYNLNEDAMADKIVEIAQKICSRI